MVIFEALLKKPEGTLHSLVISTLFGIADAHLQLKTPEAGDDFIEDFIDHHPEDSDLALIFAKLDELYRAEKKPAVADHLPGMTASKTVLPVLGVPVESKALKGLDSLLSIAQMPSGVPVGTLAIGKSGAVNAALLAAAILGVKHPAIREAFRKFRADQTGRVLANPDPSVAPPPARASKEKGVVTAEKVADWTE